MCANSDAEPISIKTIDGCAGAPPDAIIDTIKKNPHREASDKIVVFVAEQYRERERHLSGSGRRETGYDT